MLEGLSVDKVTSEFPIIKLTGAVKAVKNSKPGDKVIQNVETRATLLTSCQG